jgi:ankyrin repeat protein
MAAAGVGEPTDDWVDVSLPKSQREARALDAIKLATELGADVNLADENGRTALDAATAAKYDSVIAFLTEHGAKPGVPTTK